MLAPLPVIATRFALLFLLFGGKAPKVDRRGPRSARAGALLAALLPLAGSGAGFDPRDTASWAIPRADLYGVELKGERAWAVGYWGSVLRSEDGGRSWSRQATPTDENLHAVSFSDASHGWAVGAGGVVLRSEDGGRSWRRVPVGARGERGRERGDAPLFDVAAVSRDEAWAVGDYGRILHTVNGRDWEPVSIPEETYADDEIPDRILNAVDFADAERGWIAGEFGTVLRTRDGGRSWVAERRFEGAADDVHLLALAADTEGRALAGGVGGVVLRSAGGGAAWVAADLPARAGLYGAALRGARALLVGDGGALYASRDGGARWFEPERPRLFRWLAAVVLGAEGRALAVGEGGLVLRSSDGGRSWQRSRGAGGRAQ